MSRALLEEKKKEHIRKSVDELVHHLPPDLVDGMATIPYLEGAVEREAEQRRQKNRGVGGRGT